MNCRYCGAELPNDAKYCANCGAAVIAEEVQHAAPEIYQQPAEPAAQKPAEDNSTSILVLGILGLVFPFISLGLVGIILSAIGMAKAKKFRIAHGSLYGKAEVGRGLSIAGLVISILSVLAVIAIGVIFGLAAVSGEFIYY